MSAHTISHATHKKMTNPIGLIFRLQERKAKSLFAVNNLEKIRILFDFSRWLIWFSPPAEGSGGGAVSTPPYIRLSQFEALWNGVGT